MALPSRPKFDWELWLWWVVSSAAGWLVGYVIVQAIGQLVGEDFATAAFAGGITAGVGQWLVLRRQISGAKWWILATAAGQIVGLAANWVIFMALAFWVSAATPLLLGAPATDLLFASIWILSGALGQTLVGATQWLILRQHVHRAGWWILASGMSWLVGQSLTIPFLASGISGGTSAADWTGGQGMFLVAGWAGLVLGWMITGAVLVRLLAQRRVILEGTTPALAGLRAEGQPLSPAHPRFPLTLWLWWILATTVGWAAGVAAKELADRALNVAVYQSITRPQGPDAPAVTVAFLLDVISLAAMGAIVGLAQWLVLRRYLRRVGWWILACVAGAGAGSLAGSALVLALVWTVAVLGTALLMLGPNPLSFVGIFLIGITYWFGSGLVVGITIGLAQWLALRRHLRRAGWWVLVSTIAWSMSMFLNSLGGLAVLAVAGVALGVFTGSALALLLGQGPPAGQPPANKSSLPPVHPEGGSCEQDTDRIITDGPQGGQES